MKIKAMNSAIPSDKKNIICIEIKEINIEKQYRRYAKKNKNILRNLQV